MADQPSKDTSKLDAKIKELQKRTEELESSVDEAHKASEATKAATTNSAKDLSNLKQRK